MKKTYELEVCGLKRQLPLIAINDSTAIASFVLLGDAELTHYAAKDLLKLLPESFDYIVTMESKGVPLAQELSFQAGKGRYIVLRKSIKDYMENPITQTVNSITTKTPQKLVLDQKEADLIRGKKIVIVDDVISSGSSVEAACDLVEQIGGNVCSKLAILAEGDAIGREDVKYLGTLPLFNHPDGTPQQ